MQPLTVAVAVSTWTLDAPSLVLIVLAALAYGRCYPAACRGAGTGAAQAWCFGIGLALWALATQSAVAAYAPVLFWMRALQVLMLLFVAPFFIALGRPVVTLGLAAFVDNRFARIAFSPLVTSVAMLATPWLLYLTPWYVASMTGYLAGVTRVVLVVIGFAYFYARLQADPVPRRYSPFLSMGISMAESIADGLLGLVLWLGPLIAYDYYAGLHRDWGPSMRTDQSVGAGILWILGDVVGIPFVLVLMRALGSHERRRAAVIDAELDAELDAETDDAADDRAAPALWWESDPQLRDRFGRG